MINLITSYDCNCECTYCFEKDRVGDFNNNAQTSKVLEYIDNIIDKNSPKELHINFFGGEPMMNQEAICEISHYYKRRINSNFNITTNGTLFNEESARRVIEAGVKHFQITLDGEKETHDNRRPLANRHSSWNRIISGIGILIKYDVNITIRINIDSRNIENFDRIFEELPDDIVKSEKITYYISPVIGESSDNYLIDKKNIMLKAWKKIKQLSLPIEVVLPRFSPCSHDSLYNGFYIDLQGNIYSCGADVGNVNKIEGKFDKRNKNYSKRIEGNIMKQCYCCEFVYDCMGGCKYEYETNKIKCQKVLFEELYDYYYDNYVFI